MKKNILILFLIIISCKTFAGGSVYSRYGFGDLLHFGDSRIYALGGTGIALADDGFINRLNPAGTSKILFTRFSGGFEYNNISSKDANNSSNYSFGGLQDISCAIPISIENRIVLSLESTPYSKVNYGVSIVDKNNVTGIVQNDTIYGNGGLSYFGCGLTVEPIKKLYMGLRLNYFYGRIRNFQTSSYESSDYTSTTINKNRYYSGFSFTLGGIYEGIGDILNNNKLNNLSLGFVITTRCPLNVEEETVYSSISSIFSNKKNTNIPLSVGLGLSYKLDNNTNLLGDIFLQNWKSATLDASLQNLFRTSVGYELLPKKDAETFWSKNIYRFGFAYNSTYYNINGTGIKEILLSSGIGFPLSTESWLNIGLQVGMRGKVTDILQKDTIIRASIGISASEVWFMQFDEE